LDRTVYDAQHRKSLSRDKTFIKEGGPLISEIKDPSKDANECYVGFGKTYDFYLKYFNRNSLNNRGFPLDGFVHYGIDYENAFFDGQQMVFGDGSNLFNGFTDELDVIGHELTHGVVEYTCKLEYEFQSGALNESLADVFGIMIKQWGEDLDKPQTAAEANWLIGEGIWRQGINGRALRDMKNPGTAFDDPMIGKDPQPAHWKDFVVLPNTERGDFGGVHINSGIPNRAFVLASTKIGGFAWEGAGQIWYKAMTGGNLKIRATFKEFADATINNAGEHATDVKKAWEEVGYPFP
jgi:Zn-dependent metalloprotease